MKSSPASSPSFASARQSSQLADQRSGTVVAERPDEQLAPNSPILSALSLYMAIRDCMDAVGASTLSSQEIVAADHTTGFGRRVPTSPCGCHDDAISRRRERVARTGDRPPPAASRRCRRRAPPAPWRRASWYRGRCAGLLRYIRDPASSLQTPPAVRRSAPPALAAERATAVPR